MSSLNELYLASQSKNLVVLSVNTDDSDRNAAEELIKEKNLAFPILWDDKKDVNRAYNLKAYPTSFFIDRYGVIREVVVGSMLRSTMDDKVKQIY